MRTRLIVLALAVLACAVTALLAMPRMDLVCAAQKALHLRDADHARWSCLHYAAARGDTRVIEHMLDYGADPDQRNADGRTPLAEAARRGQLDAVKTLLAHGAQVDVYDTASGFTPLHLAAQYNHPAVVRRLIAAGAQVNARNQWNQTPLWQAAWQDWHGNTEVAHILVAHGSEVDIADDKGHTALQMAARAGHLPMVRYLLDQGADMARTNNTGRTPLYQAVLGNHLDVARLLLERGADPNAAAGEYTPLRTALADQHLDMADLLHAHGATGYERYAAQARLDRGYGLLENQRFDAAIAEFDAAIALRPDNAQGYYYRGLALERSGRSVAAADDFSRAVSLDPSDSDALEKFGQLQSELGRHASAVDAFRRLIEQRPDYGRAYFLLAHSLRSIGKRDQAGEKAAQACQLGYQPACG